MAKKKKFYAVVKGKRPGIYSEWAGDNGAEIQVKGFSGAIFKGFTTYKEAAAFMVKGVPAKAATFRAGRAAHFTTLNIFSDIAFT